MVKKKREEKPLETPEDLEKFMSEEPVEEDTMPLEEEEAPPPARKDARAPEIIEEDAQGGDMLSIAADVPVQVVAVMGKKSITIKELALLRMGEVIELGRPANEIVDLVAGGRLIAKGELVEIEGKLGVRIVKMVK